MLAGLGLREEQQTCTPQKQTVTHRVILTTCARTSLVRTLFILLCPYFHPPSSLPAALAKRPGRAELGRRVLFLKADLDFVFPADTRGEVFTHQLYL